MLFRFPKVVGMAPDKSLSRKSKNSRLDKFPMEGGIDPVNSLLPRLSVCKLEKFPIKEGIAPVRSCPENESQVRFVRLAKEAGIGPLKPPAKALVILSVLRLVMDPIDVGKVPVTLVRFKDKKTSCVNCDISEGSVPVTLRSFTILIDQTRPAEHCTLG